MKNYFRYIAILALGIVSCEPEFENSIEDDGFYSNGEADFTTYVALGNSLTAGYADGALYRTGQENSYPNILASKFALTQDTDDFMQPLVDDNIGGLLYGGNQIAETRFVLAGESIQTAFPGRYNGTPTTEVTERLSGMYNNMGVPGAKSFHLVAPGYGSISGVPVGTANPYFARFASSDNTTVVADAMAQQPTFFSLWIGNNDVLGYATSGGTGEFQLNNTDPSTYGENDITDPNTFAFVYNNIVGALAENADGVLINIPNVAAVPYFTTVPVRPLRSDDPDFGPQIPTLNATFAPLNQAFQFLQQPGRQIAFNESGASPVLIRDESLADVSAQLTQVLTQGGVDPTTAALYGQQFGQSRQATDEDLLVLTSSSVIGTVNQQRMQQLMGFGLDQQTAAQLSVNGVTYPLEDQYTLTASEIGFVENATSAYNVAIGQIAQSYGLALVDANGLLDDLQDSGIPFDGGMITSQFASGGAFSLDGIHLTPRGNAVIANAIIDAINSTYGSTVPKANPGAYGTIQVGNNVR